MKYLTGLSEQMVQMLSDQNFEFEIIDKEDGEYTVIFPTSDEQYGAYNMIFQESSMFLNNLTNEMVERIKTVCDEHWLYELQMAGGKKAVAFLDENDKKKAEEVLVEVRSTEQLSKEQEEFFKDSKCRKEDGTLEVFYHGTGTTIEAFDPAYAEQGAMQYGSGFYFSNRFETADIYTQTENVDYQTGEKIGKIGGLDNPNVVSAYINIKNPYVINYDPDSIDNNLRAIDVTAKDAYKILLQSPNLHLSSEDGNLLGDYLDSYWDVCDSLKKKSDFAPLIRKLVNHYFKDGTDLLSLDSFFDDHEKEFRQAIYDTTGHDGIIVNFTDGERFAIPWFPEQIKSVENRFPKETVFLMDDPTPVQTFTDTEKDTPSEPSFLEMVDEWKKKGIDLPVDEKGMITLYHRTSLQNAQKILETGMFCAKEPCMYFSTKEDSPYTEGYGDTAICFKIPLDKVQADDYFTEGKEVHFSYDIGFSANKDGYMFDVSSMLGNNDKIKETLKYRDSEQKKEEKTVHKEEKNRVGKDKSEMRY